MTFFSSGALNPRFMDYLDKLGLIKSSKASKIIYLL